MKGVKEIKARLVSVGNIRKVTSTMELVAAAKMKKLQERALQSRPYGEAIRGMIARIAGHVAGDVSPLLLQPEKTEVEALVVIASDKGLCGAFNANVLRLANQRLKENEASGVRTKIYAVGLRTEKFFRKIGAEFLGVCEERVDKLGHRRVSEMMRALTADFVAGDVQRVSVAYTWFKSAASFEPRIEQLLPLAAIETDENPDEPELDYILEPSPEFILQRLLPKSLEVKLYGAVLESLASEFASRRIAMKNATDAADDMTDELTMDYNKARQSGITAELLEIISGADALA